MDIWEYLRNVKMFTSVFGLSQTALFLTLAGWGIKWSSHKVLTSVLNTQQLEAYREYPYYGKILIGLFYAGTEFIVFLFSFIVIIKGLWSFYQTPLSLFPFVYGNSNLE